MSESKPSVQDIIFIGSGISTSFSLIKLMKLVEKKGVPEKLFISIIEKNSEFHTGIPYGSRSGFSALLITSLRNFLPQPQLADFLIWLNENKIWLLKEFEKEGGERSKVWLETHAKELKNNEWEDLFIPRRFFGCYIEQKVKREIERLENKNLIKVSYISSEVLDTEEHSDYWEISLKNNGKLYAKKVVLAIGSLPTKSLWKKSALIEKDNLLFINKPYQKSLPQTLKTIKEFTQKRTAKNTNLIIIGANASGLELLYKIHDYNLAIDSFTILSTKGILPDAEIDKEKLLTYRPKFLWQLKEESTLNAEQIAEATFKDLNEAEKIQLGAASTVGIISSAFGSLLSRLNSVELKKFACFYGNEIGRRQRCAGVQYSNTIEVLKTQNKFNHIAGKFSTIHKTSSGEYTVEYLDTATQKNIIVDKPANIVINCIGGMNFTDQELPNFLKNLIHKKIITINSSKIGIDVNDNLESAQNFYINGPLLAGNVIEDEAVWHVEHCGRIIKFSELLATKLFPSEYAFRVLSLDNPLDVKKYNALLSKFYDNNPYYCYSYFCHHQNSTNKLIAFELRNSANSLAIMPIILRSIKNSTSFDVISPYGYSGPLFIDTIKPKAKKVFWEFVDRWYAENNIVSEFIRFDLNGNNKEYSGNLCETLDNVYGTLSSNFEEQWHNFSSKVRNNYRKACTYELVFKIYENQEIREQEISSFYTIYLSTMKRNSAPEFLFFSEHYFKNLILNNPTHYAIALTTYKGIPISTELIINHKNYLHAFLGGTDSDYFNLRPNDYLRVEVIKWGIKKGKKTYILGGGICNGDGLYKSKKALFPKSADRIFYTGRKILDPTSYQELVQKNQVSKSNSTAFDFFLNTVNQTNMIHRITDKKDWKNVLEAMDNYDFYHTYDYHNLSKLENQSPILLFYKKNTTKIALPLLIQPIQNTEYFDATSVYGYAGPIVGEIEDIDLQEFASALNKFLKNEKIIAVFSRLNPLIKNQELVLSTLGTIVELGSVVAIKLDETLESQRANYSKITKRYLNKLKKECTIVKSDTPEDVLKFIPLYYETMKRVSAETSYFFDKDYFLNLMRSTDFKTEIIFAILNDTQEIVSAALMIKTQGKIIQYHLSGTREEYLDKSPLRLIIDQTRINGTEQNFQYLNLGGGIGSKADSLFQFKATFSNTYKNFKVWKYIVNQKIYDEICLNKGFKPASGDTSFFPIYRSPTVIYDK